MEESRDSRIITNQVPHLSLLVAAAALDRGLVSPDDQFDCQWGSIVLAGIVMKDHKPFGVLTFREDYRKIKQCWHDQNWIKNWPARTCSICAFCLDSDKKQELIYQEKVPAYYDLRKSGLPFRLERFQLDRK